MTAVQITGVPDAVPVRCEKEQRGEAEVYSVTIGRADGEAVALSELRVTVTADASGALGRWFPAAYQYSRGVRQTWNSASASEYMFDAPVYSYYRSDDANLLTAAIDDTHIPWRFRCGIDESLRMLRFTASPDGVCARQLSFRVFVDRSHRPYYEAIRDVACWWAECKGGMPAIPACAYDPVYSTWYALHRDIDENNVLAECETAAKLGMKTVFVDDGWTTPAESEGFEHAGDWVPNAEKFPDCKDFVDRIHALGMKSVLWVAPGLCGYAKAAAHRLAGRSLSAHDGYKAYILDPRDPIVRDTLVRDLCAILMEYGFDGLKIDFVDVILGADAAIDDNHDYTSVAEALEVLLSTIYREMRRIRPDVLVEYRQSYTGPDILKNANIIRSADCAQDFLTNRVNTIDLRLYTNVAVHADMIQIIEGEDPEDSALQLTNVLFATPQISVRWERLREDQVRMLQFWIGFLSEHRGLLQQSSFEPAHCYANYPVVTVRNENERLTALYGERFLMLDRPSPVLYVVNAYGREHVYIGSEQPVSIHWRTLDCMGRETAQGETTLDDTPQPFKIPINGVLIAEM